MSDAGSGNPKEQLKASLADIVFDKSQWSGRSTDWFLQWIVDFVSRTEGEVSITLTVGGNMISGSLISHKDYFTSMSESLSKPFESDGPETAEAMKELILSFSPQPHAGENENSPQYLHLKDARIYTNSNAPISPTGVLWRGKISAVEGFSFGRIAVV